MNWGFESSAIVVMCCLGTFVIGFISGYALRGDEERKLNKEKKS